MEITLNGTIFAVMQPREGIAASTGNAWKVQEFVIEDDHQKKCVFEVFGIDRLNEWNIAVGDIVTIRADVDAREYNGRWYNTIRAWHLERPNTPQPVKSCNDIPF